MKHAARILALALALWCLAWGAMGLGETRNDLPVVVSLGDSYSSGEGIEDFYDQELPMVQRTGWPTGPSSAGPDCSRCPGSARP